MAHSKSVRRERYQTALIEAENWVHACKPNNRKKTTYSAADVQISVNENGEVQAVFRRHTRKEYDLVLALCGKRKPKKLQSQAPTATEQGLITYTV